MKFVWVPSINRFRRTETECKKEKLAYEVVEYETDKDSLIDRFNAYEQRIEELTQQLNLGGHTAAPQPTVEDEPEPVSVVSSPPPPAPVPPPAPANDAPKKTLEEVISEMPAVKLAPLVESTVTRLGELGEAGFEALDDYQGSHGIGGSFSRGVHVLSTLAMGEHQLSRLLFRARKQPKQFGARA